MNTSVPAAGWLGCLLVLVLGVSACGRSSHETPIERTKQASSTSSVTVRNPFRGDSVPVPAGERHFYVLSRTDEIGAFPCSNCHVGNDRVQSVTPPGRRKAHWDVTLNHGEADDMTCASCHNPNDMNRLRTVFGDTVGFDRSYRTCGGCHAPQRADWEGGAHGKQVGGWGRPRVIHNCTTCHDPHDPSYEKRWPVTFPSIPRGGGRR